MYGRVLMKLSQLDLPIIKFTSFDIDIFNFQGHGFTGEGHVQHI